MPETDAQARKAQEIAEEYSGQVRITPNTGAGKDHTVVACPDGRTVVIEPDGCLAADTMAMEPITKEARAAVERLLDSPVIDKQTPGYDPALDVLLIETCDAEWTLVPPWRCAMTTGEHLPLSGVEGLLVTLRAWYSNFNEGELVVWELLRGERVLQRASR